MTDALAVLTEGLGTFLAGCVLTAGFDGLAPVGGASTLALLIAGFARGSVRGLALIAATGGVLFLGFIDRPADRTVVAPAFPDPGDFFAAEACCAAGRVRLLGSAFEVDT